MRRDPIEICPYDPRWAGAFEEQRERLQAVLSPWLQEPIEHIGSTSIPGMPAKPIVDMLALVKDWSTFSSAVGEVTAIGWVHAPEPSDRNQRRWSMCYPSIEHRSHHLHVVEYHSSQWASWILFRDYLRTHAVPRDRYADLKRRLAAADDADRARYRAGKAPLIEELMDEARAWRAVGGREV